MTPTDFKPLWAAIMRKLESSIQRAMLITWFKDTAVIGKEEGKLIVGLPLPMFLNWHLEHYKDCTLKAAQELDATIGQIVYQVDISLRDSAHVG